MPGTNLFTDEEFYKCKTALTASFMVHASVQSLQQVYEMSLVGMFGRLENYGETSPERFKEMHTVDSTGNIVLSKLAERSLQSCGRTDTIDETITYCERIARPEARSHPKVKEWAGVLLSFMQTLPPCDGTAAAAEEEFRMCSRCGMMISTV
jgi:hypothetical protein